ncbi:MAG: CBS domain-containing protein, partial [Candidatus Methylarchaceae archaeon HK02M2]|nr:CBS domain-containing protein [Candidatus Methylarchaceae archaeon HK02M2]
MVKDLMNVNVISFRQSEKISKVAETFVKLGISGAPVIDDYNNVVGIISERDIIELFKSKSSILGKTEDLIDDTLQFFHIYPIASLKFRRTIRELNQEE